MQLVLLAVRRHQAEDAGVSALNGDTHPPHSRAPSIICRGVVDKLHPRRGTQQAHLRAALPPPAVCRRQPQRLSLLPRAAPASSPSRRWPGKPWIWGVGVSCRICGKKRNGARGGLLAARVFLMRWPVQSRRRPRPGRVSSQGRDSRRFQFLWDRRLDL